MCRGGIDLVRPGDVLLLNVLIYDCRPIADCEENLGLACRYCIGSAMVGLVRGLIAFLPALAA